MFIKVTLNGSLTYVNVAHIQGMWPNGSETNIWLSDGGNITVETTSDEILKQIEEAQEHGKKD